MEKKLEPSLRFKDFNDVYKNYVLNDVLDLLTDFESNGSFASVKENVNIYEEKNYAWYVRATDLENNSSLDKVKYVDEHSYKFLKKTPLFGDELLITKRGEIGKVYFFKSEKDVKATVAPNMYLLKLNMLVDSKYVYYSFINNDGNKKLKRINASTTIGALYKDDVKSIKVRFPKIEEQQKIASFLTDVDDRITKLTKKKTLLEEYKKGIMQKIFSQELRFKDDNGNEFPKWNKSNIGNVFKSFKGKGIPKSDVTIDGRNKCILYGELYTTYNEVISKVVSSTNSEDGLKSEKGDLLIPSSTTTTGIDLANITALNFDDVLLGGDIIVMRGKKEINNIFYAYYLSNFKKHQIASRAQGITIVHIYFNSIKDLEIDVPVIEEQTKIANFLSDIDIKIEALNTKIENSKSFKKGLLQQMFV